MTSLKKGQRTKKPNCKDARLRRTPGGSAQVKDVEKIQVRQFRNFPVPVGLDRWNNPKD